MAAGGFLVHAEPVRARVGDIPLDLTAEPCNAHGLPSCHVCAKNLQRARAKGGGEWRRTTPRKRKDRHVPGDSSSVERRAKLPSDDELRRRLEARFTREELGELLPLADLRLQRAIVRALSEPLPEYEPHEPGPRETKPWLTF